MNSKKKDVLRDSSTESAQKVWKDVREAAGEAPAWVIARVNDKVVNQAAPGSKKTKI